MIGADYSRASRVSLVVCMFIGSFVLASCVRDVPQGSELELEDAQFIGHTIDIFDNAETQNSVFLSAEGGVAAKGIKKAGYQYFSALRRLDSGFIATSSVELIMVDGVTGEVDTIAMPDGDKGSLTKVAVADREPQNTTVVYEFNETGDNPVGNYDSILVTVHDGVAKDSGRRIRPVDAMTACEDGSVHWIERDIEITGERREFGPAIYMYWAADADEPAEIPIDGQELDYAAISGGTLGCNGETGYYVRGDFDEKRGESFATSTEITFDGEKVDVGETIELGYVPERRLARFDDVDTKTKRYSVFDEDGNFSTVDLKTGEWIFDRVSVVPPLWGYSMTFDENMAYMVNSAPEGEKEVFEVLAISLDDPTCTHSTRIAAYQGHENPPRGWIATDSMVPINVFPPVPESSCG
ncbi:hypothetical protein ACTXKO_00410 [Corynebacterium casei]|uniref:hypothetical protein n=1 Tax=Corynebacterium casei TaxID=160386 RepID=UPI003FD4A424